MIRFFFRTLGLVFIVAMLAQGGGLASPENLQDRLHQIEQRITELQDKQLSQQVRDSKKPSPIQFVKRISMPGLDAGQLLSPRGIIATTKGLFVADMDNKRIEQFGFDGHYINSFGDLRLPGAEHLKAPVSLIEGFGETLWVVDRDNDAIVQYQTNGAFMAAFGGLGEEKGKFNAPAGIAIDSKGYLYVADSGNDRVQKMAPDGAVVAVWGTYGRSEYTFDNPLDVAIDKKGNLYILDRGSKKVKKYSEYFQFIQDISRRDWVNPVAIEIDEKDHLYVADSYTGKVYILTAMGQPLGEITTGIKAPFGITVRDRYIYITDDKYHQIVVYRKGPDF